MTHTTIRELHGDEMLEAMQQDKKVHRGALQVVGVDELGGRDVEVHLNPGAGHC